MKMMWGELKPGDSIAGKTTLNVYTVLSKSKDSAGQEWLLMYSLHNPGTFWKRAASDFELNFFTVFRANE